MSAQLTVTVESGNAAFADGCAVAELQRILDHARDRLETLVNTGGWMSESLLDVNGNRVGEIFVEVDDD